MSNLSQTRENISGTMDDGWRRSIVVLPHVPPSQIVFCRYSRKQHSQRITLKASTLSHQWLPVISLCVLALLYKWDYGVIIRMNPNQLPIPTSNDTIIPSPVWSNRYHKAKAANAITAYNWTWLVQFNLYSSVLKRARRTLAAQANPTTPPRYLIGILHSARSHRGCLSSGILLCVLRCFSSTCFE
jgi:hypothetical protein